MEKSIKGASQAFFKKEGVPSEHLPLSFPAEGMLRLGPYPPPLFDISDPEDSFFLPSFDLFPPSVVGCRCMTVQVWFRN